MSAVNEPACVAIHFKAPIRKGICHAGPMVYHPEEGPYVLGLSPVGHSAHG